MLMFLGGWALMVGVAMVPGTLPAARLVAATKGVADAAGFLAGYAAAWIALGAAAFAIASPLHPLVRWAGAGGALAAAAAYELSPSKDACLRRCRSPLRILLRRSVGGGVTHAFDCAGCCAMLMTLMVALDLMNLAWAGVLALVVVVQKAAPLGERSPRALALALGATAVVTWI